MAKSSATIVFTIQGDERSFKALTKNAEALRNALTGTMKAGNSASNSFRKMKSSMSGLTKQVAGLAAGYVSFKAAAGVVADAVQTVASFERANSELASVLGTTREGVRGLTESAKELGRTTEFTASEVTSLQTSLARLGFDQGQITAMQEPVLKFAAAVGTDLASAADFAGSALRAFGLDSEDTGALLDVMAKSTSASALSFSKLYESMSIMGPVANAFGLSVEDAISFMGVLSNAGFDASSAATALRNILLNLADANGKLAKGLGGPARTMPELISAFKRLRDSGVDLNATLEMTDKKSVAAFNALLAGADDLEILNNKLYDANGSLDAMYKTMTDNLAGAVKGLESAWEGLKLSMDDTSFLTRLVNSFAQSLNGISDSFVFSQKGTKGGEWENSYYQKLVGGKSPQDIATELKDSKPMWIESGGTIEKAWKARKEAFDRAFAEWIQNGSPLASDRKNDLFENVASKVKSKKSGKGGDDGGDEGSKKKIKDVSEALKEMNASASRAVEINQLFGATMSDEAVRLDALESGLKSVIRQYGAGSEAVKAFYHSFVTEKRAAMTRGGSLTDGLKEIKIPGAKAQSGGLAGSRPNYDTGAVTAYTSALEDQDGVIGTITNSIMQMSGAIEGSAAAWVTWGANLAASVAKAIPMILALTTANKKQGASAAFTAGAEAGKAVSGIPIVGPALAIAAIASVAAALLAMPKFAEGGLAFGATLGLFGEYPGARTNPEVVAPLSKLRPMLGSGLGGGEVRFRIEGRDLYGLLEKEGRILKRG